MARKPDLVANAKRAIQLIGGYKELVESAKLPQRALENMFRGTHRLRPVALLRKIAKTFADDPLIEKINKECGADFGEYETWLLVWQADREARRQ